MVDYTQDVSKLSAGQLGKSLLAQKDARDTADRKKARRNDKIQGALVLALAGKGFARNAYNKRKEELDKIQTFQAKNNEAQAKEIANVSSILSIIPENYMPNEKDANKKAKAFMKGAEDLYTAEDDFFKIANFAVERLRLKNAYTAAGRKFTDDLLDNQAADIVRNTVPNYAYVSDLSLIHI